MTWSCPHARQAFQQLYRDKPVPTGTQKVQIPERVLTSRDMKAIKVLHDKNLLNE